MAKTSTGAHDRQDAGEPALSGPIDASALISTSLARRDALASAPSGVAMGTLVMTLDGLLPVEFLSPGDMLVTRSGARVLRRIASQQFSGEMVRVAPGALGHDRPEQPLLLLPGTLLHLRDWRARALFGDASVLCPAQRLIDGVHVVREHVGYKLVYTLGFDKSEIVYADGVEMACAAVRRTH